MKSDILWPKNNVFRVLAQSVFKQEVVQYERFVSSSVDKKKKVFFSFFFFFFDVVSFRIKFFDIRTFFAELIIHILTFQLSASYSTQWAKKSKVYGSFFKLRSPEAGGSKFENKQYLLVLFSSTLLYT